MEGTAAEGMIPPNVIYSFYCGAAILLLSILWTLCTTKEYSPEEIVSFEDAVLEVENTKHRSGLLAIAEDFKLMPITMKQLGTVQFFSWFALFMMWVYTTPAIAEHIFYLKDGEKSKLYMDAANWVGVLFGIYNGVSAIYALFLAKIANKYGRKQTHAFSLTMGGLGLISIFLISDPIFLIIPMIGVGLAWGSILAMPYAILSDTLPAKKMGVYMGIFNFFITFPQIVCGFLGGYMIKLFFNSNSIYGILLAGIFMLLGALSVLRIKDKI
ncbi:MFS transporter [Sphingobacterium sp. SG20118]|uniref:MFS transporter n=1 Tax=Sphingobacterium sp. SG20118 TaxID=3367156 RepID=UPI0037DFC67A